MEDPLEQIWQDWLGAGAGNGGRFFFLCLGAAAAVDAGRTVLYDGRFGARGSA